MGSAGMVLCDSEGDPIVWIARAKFSRPLGRAHRFGGIGDGVTPRQRDVVKRERRLERCRREIAGRRRKRRRFRGDSNCKAFWLPCNCNGRF